MDLQLGEIVVVKSRDLKNPDCGGYTVLKIKAMEPDEGVTARDKKFISLELEYPDPGKETESVLGSEVRKANAEEEAIFYLKVLRDS